MARKECSKCGSLKEITRFNFKNKSKGIRNARCKMCTRKDTMSSYYKNRQHYLEYRSKLNKKLYGQSSRFLYQFLLKHPCIDCGIGDPVVLHFDHVRGTKKYNISSMSRSRFTVTAIKKEMKKCVVRCANCHSKKTAKERGYYAWTRG